MVCSSERIDSNKNPNKAKESGAEYHEIAGQMAKANDDANDCSQKAERPASALPSPELMTQSGKRGTKLHIAAPTPPS